MAYWSFILWGRTGTHYHILAVRRRSGFTEWKTTALVRNLGPTTVPKAECRPHPAPAQLSTHTDCWYVLGCWVQAVRGGSGWLGLGVRRALSPSAVSSGEHRLVGDEELLQLKSLSGPSRHLPIILICMQTSTHPLQTLLPQVDSHARY